MERLSDTQVISNLRLLACYQNYTSHIFCNKKGSHSLDSSLDIINNAPRKKKTYKTVYRQKTMGSFSLREKNMTGR